MLIFFIGKEQKHRMGLAEETAIVALTFGAVAWGALAVTPPRSSFWVLCAVGGMLHLAFEASGLNGLYCKVGHACQ